MCSCCNLRPWTEPYKGRVPITHGRHVFVGCGWGTCATGAFITAHQATPPKTNGREYRRGAPLPGSCSLTHCTRGQGCVWTWVGTSNANWALSSVCPCALDVIQHKRLPRDRFPLPSSRASSYDNSLKAGTSMMWGSPFLRRVTCRTADKVQLFITESLATAMAK